MVRYTIILQRGHHGHCLSPSCIPWAWDGPRDFYNPCTPHQTSRSYIHLSSERFVVCVFVFLVWPINNPRICDAWKRLYTASTVYKYVAHHSLPCSSTHFTVSSVFLDDRFDKLWSSSRLSFSQLPSVQQHSTKPRKPSARSLTVYFTPLTPSDNFKHG